MSKNYKSEAVQAQLRANRRVLAVGIAIVGTGAFAVLIISLPLSNRNEQMLLALTPVANATRIERQDVVEAARSAGALVMQSQIPRPAAQTIDQSEQSSERAEDTRPQNHDIMFDGRVIRPVKTLHMVVTAYSPDEKSCGEFADGITASGYTVWTNGMEMVAADTDVLPFGSLVSVPGYANERVVPVLDRGGAIKGNRLDVLYPTNAIAELWGVREVEVTVWGYADDLVAMKTPESARE
ncbi:MAG TPA: 3D domain-containing protein [Phycisphaerales bacterium]|nr:3D domain-containing protein [Phycisphaerales bacterium]